MKTLLKIILTIFICGINYSFAAINLTVSPIKYELELNPGSSTVQTATLYNYGTNDIKIVTGKSDFVALGEDGRPKFVRYSELVHQDQQLSSWITLNSEGFIIPAKSKKEIKFTIKIPENATPGGHYGAVFFKNNNSESSNSNGTAVGINVDYGIIILVKVSGDIITDINIDEDNIRVINGGGGYSSYSKKFYNLNKDGKLSSSNGLVKKDNCLLDFTSSNFDGKCFDDPKKIVDIALGKEKVQKDVQEIEKINNEKSEIKKEERTNEKNLSENIVKDKKSKNQKSKTKLDDLKYTKEKKFNVSFIIPIDNKGNTHIKTTGEIKLFDEDGNQIKQIGKKVIVNDRGAIIGEKIVDYVPINDNKGNILPGTRRVFMPEWKGFPFKERDEEGEMVIKYKTPGEYYSDESIKKEFRLMPWERICFDKQTKKIVAKFNISYLDEKGEEVSFPSAREFDVTYTRKYVGYNYYFIFPLGIIIFFIFIIWLLIIFNRKKCINKKCRRKIKRSAKICKYCGEKQKRKKK